MSSLLERLRAQRSDIGLMSLDKPEPQAVVHAEGRFLRLIEQPEIVRCSVIEPATDSTKQLAESQCQAALSGDVLTGEGFNKFCSGMIALLGGIRIAPYSDRSVPLYCSSVRSWVTFVRIADRWHDYAAIEIGSEPPRKRRARTSKREKISVSRVITFGHVMDENLSLEGEPMAQCMVRITPPNMPMSASEYLPTNATPINRSELKDICSILYLIYESPPKT